VRAHGLLALLALTTLSTQARAQACCVEPGSHELAVVGELQRAALAAQLSYDFGYGSSDGEGDYARLRGAHVHDIVLALGAGLRFLPRWQVHASAPLHLQHRNLPGLAGATQVRFGDTAAALRFLALREPQGWPPAIELVLGVTAPSGRAPEDAQEPSGADITGHGAWMLSAGAAFSKRVSERDRLLLSAFYGYTAPRTLTGPARDFDAGDELHIRVSSWHALSAHWAWGMLGTLRFAGGVEEDGAEVPDSALYRVRFGAYLEHYPSSPHWQLNTSLSFDPPLSGLARNVPFTSATLGFRVTRMFGE
jgi:hypothetical protein